MNERDPFSTYRQRLEAIGFRPSRRLGQNFLLQPELHRLIADAAGVLPTDVVLEIGAGLGFLTRELARRAYCVVAVEIDARLHRLLAEDLSTFDGGSRVNLVHADVLGRGGQLAAPVLQALAPVLPGRALRVVANLPYAITGPVLATLCIGDVLPESMAILIQREVGERLAAKPGTPAWGSLSALMQALYDVRVVRGIGREVFRPRPNVDSTVVSLTQHAQGIATLPASERTSFAAFARALFGERRKKIRHRLAAAARAAGIAAGPGTGPPTSDAVLDARPGELGCAALIALWQSVRMA